MDDRLRLYAAALLRALATGLVGVVLGLHLLARGFAPSAIGLVLSAGLVGATLAALVVSFAGDRFGRRRALMALALLGGAGGLVVALTAAPTLAILAAALGMLNGMGRDRGAALVLEQAMLPATGADAERTRRFAWYNLMQDLGHALGGLAGGLPALLHGVGGPSEGAALQGAMLGYAGLLLATLPLYAGLSSRLEAADARLRPALAPGSVHILVRICALFALDSLAGGFIGATLMALFLHARFGADAATIAVLFFVARLANAASHLFAAWLAGRIGLVNTMVFTHIPSSLLLATITVAPDFTTAAVLLLLREGLVEMDVPTRQSYVMAVVRPGERTFAAGITHLVRLAGWAVAPAFAGALMEGADLAAPLLIAAAMKIAYDGLLWRAFRHVRPPEERR